MGKAHVETDRPAERICGAALVGAAAEPRVGPLVEPGRLRRTNPHTRAQQIPHGKSEFKQGMSV